MFGGMGDMLAKAKKMKEDMKRVQTEIKGLEATAGDNGVKVTVNGGHMTTDITIEDSLMSDKGMLEDLLLAAFNNANKEILIISAEKMKKVTVDLDLPGV